MLTSPSAGRYSTVNIHVLLFAELGTRDNCRDNLSLYRGNKLSPVALPLAMVRNSILTPRAHVPYFGVSKKTRCRDVKKLLICRLHPSHVKSRPHFTVYRSQRPKLTL